MSPSFQTETVQQILILFYVTFVTRKNFGPQAYQRPTVIFTPEEMLFHSPT